MCRYIKQVLSEKLNLNYKCPRENYNNSDLCIFHYGYEADLTTYDINKIIEKEADFKIALEEYLNFSTLERFDFIGTLFPDIDFRQKNFKLETFFTCAIFTEKADFKEAIFLKDVIFSCAKFFNFVDFYKANFSKFVDFNEAIFSEKLSFSYTTFSEIAEFSYAIFSKDAIFTEAILSAKANFNRAKFLGHAIFFLTNFSKLANFENAIFSGKTNFNTTFSEQANFKKTKFLGNVNFEKARFFQQAHFEKARFLGNADFKGSHFEKASFEKTRFLRNADFEKATLSKQAKFFQTIFLGLTVFKSTIFSEYANFREACFSEHANFREACFLRDVSFGDVSFSGKAYFDKTIFSGKAIFQNTNFLKYAGFFGAIFEDIIDLSFAKSSQNINFSKSIFLLSLKIDNTKMNKINFTDTFVNDFYLANNKIESNILFRSSCLRKIIMKDNQIKNCILTNAFYNPTEFFTKDKINKIKNDEIKKKLESFLKEIENNTDNKEKQWDFVGQDLSNFSFIECNLKFAEFTIDKMYNAEFDKCEFGRINKRSVLNPYK